MNSKPIKPGTFQPGNKLGVGGPRPGSGRPSNERRRIKAEGEAYAKQYLIKNIDKFLDAYAKAALGIKRKKFDPKGNPYYEIEYATANQRHALDKLVANRAAEDKHGDAVPPMVYVHPPLEDD